MNRFILYGTTACHLCDQAEQMLSWAATGAGLTFSYRQVDVSESEVLFERYGLSIPVLRSDDEQGLELNWPFDAEQLLAFLQGF